MSRRRTLPVLATVAAMGVTLVAAPSQSAPPPTTAAAVDYGSVVRTLRSEIPQIMAEAGVVGATVAVIDGDRVVMSEGFGWADKAHRRPVTRRTLFHIGSLSKTFAALSVMQLVERGRVDLDAPMARYVPELRLLPRFRRNVITVRSVLDHHSGIPGDVFYGLMTNGRPDPHFHQWLLDALSQMPPEGRVDTEWAYNNSGYVLLQALVENVTGEPYARRTGRTLFGRMGMPSSSFDDTRAPDRAMTRNYSPVLDAAGTPTGRVQADPREYVNGWTAGSILSSARDMTNYMRMLVHRGAGQKGRVVRAATLRQMTTPQTRLPIDLGTKIGLSWFLSDTWLGKTYGHDGATTRNFSVLQIQPRDQLGVFVSTNTDGGIVAADAIAGRALVLAYTAKTGIEPPEPVTLPDRGPATPTSATLKIARGTYAGYTGYTRVTSDGSSITLTPVDATGAAATTFSLMRNGWWRTDSDPNLQVTFRSIAGRRVLLSRTGGHSRVARAILGEKVPRTVAPRQWRNAEGVYRVHVDPMFDNGLVDRRIRLRVHRRLVVLELGTASPPERQVLRPIVGDHAYTFGLAATGGRRKGDIVRLAGQRLTYMGLEYHRVR